jgi:hypothetical protein
LVDFDGDGLQDILSGSWPGELYLFRRTDDGFAAGEILKNAGGKPINVGSAAAVFASDWEDDGDLDLLVGTIEGYVHLISNEGTAGSPAWGQAVRLQADGEDIKVDHGDAGPFAADWDGDGLHDLVVGAGSGAVVWYRNTGSGETPKLAAARTLVPDGDSSQSSDADAPSRGTRSKVCVADYNRDGRLDLLVGDFSMTQKKLEPLTDEQKAERDAVQERYGDIVQRYLKVREKIVKAQDGESRINADLLEEPLRTEYEDVSEELTGIGKELQKYRTSEYQYHGFVWVFLRGEAAEVAMD